MTTKERIVYEALKLFSEKGYEAVTTRMITGAVGIADSALYKHFRSKQEVLDAILSECQNRFMNHVSKTNFMELQWEALEQICMTFYDFQTKDEWISRFRRILMMEQFKNEHARELYRTFFVEMPIKGQAHVFTRLIEEGIIRNENPEVMAVELYAPFFLYHTWETKENRRQLEEHIEQFIKNYGVKEIEL